MKSNSLLKPGLALALGITVGASPALATPYATCLTNNSGVISFRLNEAADNVKLISNNGAVTNDLGALPKGLTTTAPLGITGTFKVQVTKSSGSGYLQGLVNQISADTNVLVQFPNPRGVAINNNPASPYFGRVYVSVATAATTTTGRVVGQGIYLLNADQTDAVGEGNTPRTGGLDWDGNATAGSESPYRLFVGPDDSLYISDWSDSRGCLYMTDANVETNSTAINVLADIGGPTGTLFNHGSTYAAYVEGSLGAGNLTVYTGDEDLSPLNSIWRYDIGAGPLPYAAPPTLFFSYGITTVAQVADMTRGPDGKWYTSNRRADNASSTGLFVTSSDGTTRLWSSLPTWREYTGNASAFDVVFSDTRGIDVSPDGKYVATIKGGTNAITILPLVDGIPNITNMVVMPVTPTTSIGRDVAFDQAGNIYSVSSGQQLLRIYSPGGLTVATTGSDGTFSLVNPLASVSVAAEEPNGNEEGPTPVRFVFYRTGGDQGTPLVINYTVSGTAVAADYTANPALGSITIPAGTNAAVLTLTPADDSVAEFVEDVKVTVIAGSQYTLGLPGAATAVIIDNETPEITIEAVSPSMYERIADDYLTFKLTRKGDTNLSVTANLTYGGTAVENVDYNAGLPTADIAAGAITGTFKLSPIDNTLLNGERLLTVTVAAGAGYVVGAAGSASGSILDDEYPPETILFADSMENDTSAAWTVRAGANNGIPDYRAQFAYDVFTDGVPMAPGAVSSTVLKLTANKDESSAQGAAGVNVYPVGKSFSGDFALRFQMYITLSTAGTTEFTTFGINHSGNKTNWFLRSVAANAPVDTDGLWYAIVSDASLLGDYTLFSSTNAATGPVELTNRFSSDFKQVFKSPPYAAGDPASIANGPGGSPANAMGNTLPTWVDVEVKKIGSTITLSMNKTVIMQSPITTPFNAGNIMLGFCDAYDSIGNDGAAYFHNVRVVDLTVPTINITRIQLVGGNVQIDFAASATDTPAAFNLTSAGTVDGSYGNVAATITQTAPGMFRAERAVAGGAQFYRIKRN